MTGSQSAIALAAESRAQAEGTAGQVWMPRARTLRDLQSDPHITAPPLWVLPPLVQSGEVALLSAPPKTGKSHLVSQLAAELSRGGHALDGSPLAAGTVLWLAFDEPIRRLVPRLTALGADPDRLHVVEREPGHVLAAGHLSALLAEHTPVLVVLDTTSQLSQDRGIDANDAAQVGPFLRPLVDAVRLAATPDVPCAGVFIHHSPHHASRAAGSLQWGAIPDADVVLRRRRREVNDDEAGAADDCERILEGVTRAEGPFKLTLSFSAGRYALADAPLPLIDRVRTQLLHDHGPGISSANRLRADLSCQQAALADVLRKLELRGEVKFVGARRSPKAHYVPTEAMRLYVSGSPQVDGNSGDEVGRSDRAKSDATSGESAATSSPLQGGTPALGKKYLASFDEAA